MKKLNWFYHRLRMAGIREIFLMRAVRFIRNRIGSPSGKVPANTMLSIEPYDDSCRSAFNKLFPDAGTQIIQEAEEILKGRIKIFGRIYQMDDPVNWNKDFVNGYLWPLAPVHNINYHVASQADPKYIWELNRQQFLPTLGLAYFLTGDDKYATKAINFIESWIDQCPFYTGINWVSCIELSVRQISWFFTLKFIWNFPGFTEALKQKICSSLYLQTKQITRNLSLYSSANNHLISELAAMVVIGTSLNQKKWVDDAVKILEKQINNQVLPDGVGAEQSPSYLLHVMEFYSLAAIILKKSGRKIPKVILDALERSSGYINTLINQFGMPPQIGDSDSGIIIKINENNYNVYKSVLNLLGFLTGNTSFIQPDIKKDDKSFWLIDPASFSEIIKTAKNEPTNKLDFPYGGYYFLEKQINDNTVHVLFDCGPLGMKPMAAHGHADALSFILYVNDQAVFIDPGTFTYFSDLKWRDYFRGTSAHNTIRVDKTNQSKNIGEFIWIKHAISKCLDWEPGRKVTGKCSTADGVIHTREISFISNGVRIKDTIDCSGRHEIEQFFHLDKSCSLIPAENNKFRIASQSKDICSIIIDPKLDAESFEGDPDLPLGWISDMYGNKESTISLRAAATMNNEFECITDISIN